jgi:hypothetical protein
LLNKNIKKTIQQWTFHLEIKSKTAVWDTCIGQGCHCLSGEQRKGWEFYDDRNYADYYERKFMAF